MHLSKENRDAKLRALCRVIVQKLKHPAAGLLIVLAGVIVMAAAAAMNGRHGWAFIGFVIAMFGFAMLAVSNTRAAD